MNEILATVNTLLHLTANMVHKACDCEELSNWMPVIGSNFRTIAKTVHSRSDMLHGTRKRRAFRLFLFFVFDTLTS